MSSQPSRCPSPADADGSLDQYIQTVNRFPLLTADEERALARRLRDENDLDAARQLVLSHLRLVVAVARGYLGYGLPHADLIQEGNIGLMKAVKRFDPERGVRLVSFAIHWIKAEMHEYILRNWRLVKVATTKAQRKLFFNLRSMKQGLDAADARARSRSIADDAEREARGSGRDGDAPVRAGHRARGRRRRRRGRLRAGRLPRRTREAEPLAAARSASRPSALRADGLSRARGARPAQPPHHRSALAAREGRRARCTTSPRSSRSRPSASARSRRRRWRRCAR